MSESQRIMGRHIPEDEAVSEVIGVVLMLSIVISIMVGVFTVLSPYLDDINSARGWSALTTNADQIQERISTAADSSENSIFHVGLNLDEIRMNPLIGMERWTVSGDLFGNDRIVSMITGTSLSIQSLNGTMVRVEIITEKNITIHDIVDVQDVIEILIDSRLPNLVIAQVYDQQNQIIHRLASIRLSGLQLTSTIAGQIYSIEMMNGALVEYLPGEVPSVSKQPRLDCVQLENGSYRASMALLNLEIEMFAINSQSTTLKLVSGGNLAIFNDDTRNILISAQTTERSLSTTAYLDDLADQYALYRSLGISQNYVGFGPLAGSVTTSGLTVYPLDETVHFSMSLQTVEVVK